MTTTTPRLVTTQAELDAALAEGVTDLIIDAPDGAYLEVRHDGFVRLRGSSRVEARDSSHVEAWGSSHVEAWGSSRVVAGRWTAVHLWSQRVTLTGGHVIDMTKVDLTDVDTWRAYVGADTLVRPDRDQLIVGHVSSEDHGGELDRDGVITIGCFSGSVAKLRKLIDGEQWPSGADAERRDKYRPRLTAFADLCEQQLAAWAEVES